MLNPHTVLSLNDEVGGVQAGKCHPLVTRLLQMEAAAINECAQRLSSEAIEQACALMASCQGKMVLIGVGKSGIVARKIAATLNSTGTVAVHLHPSDALHGDIGIISSADVAIILSNSGQTDELTLMLPHLKYRKVSIIAIVGNLNSHLARHADIVLDASVNQEACPFNLTPTTSAIVALAIGDALAITLMQMKGVMREDFALNHPSGRLGKRLTMRVQDLMYAGLESHVVKPEASWFDVVSTISKGGLGAVSVVNAEGQLVGIITDGDLRRSMQQTVPADLETLRAEAIMTRQPVVVSTDLLAYDALGLMENRLSQISVLPVIDAERRYVGMIRLHDIVQSGL